MDINRRSFMGMVLGAIISPKTIIAGEEVVRKVTLAENIGNIRLPYFIKTILFPGSNRSINIDIGITSSLPVDSMEFVKLLSMESELNETVLNQRMIDILELQLKDIQTSQPEYLNNIFEAISDTGRWNLTLGDFIIEAKKQIPEVLKNILSDLESSISQKGNKMLDQDDFDLIEKLLEHSTLTETDKQKLAHEIYKINSQIVDKWLREGERPLEELPEFKKDEYKLLPEYDVPNYESLLPLHPVIDGFDISGLKKAINNKIMDPSKKNPANRRFRR